MTNGADAQETALARDDLVSPAPTKTQRESGTGLCLFGGGYRAMVFHAGVWALNWSQLSFNPGTIQRDFVPKLVVPIRTMASKTIDASSVIGEALLPGTISEKITKAYRKHLLGHATLQDVPDDYPASTTLPRSRCLTTRIASKRAR